MTSILGLSLTALLVAGFIWFLPILLILRSRKTNGAEKLFWILAVVFVSWFAWILYLLLAPLGERKGSEH
ncbi:MAG: hypothetical protein KUF77_02000 [Candidatus Thiodiazotropha sp. (ex Lucina aurantia)]|uniref:Cardiolipin synthase N-terminal domain-containing protein n=2 Tax=Candidatus Thiodiazotropha TaxID=1913444 RepID=A0A7Z1AFS8_9GAMM|nr:hypothetical protein [Candidatus Thiodiazotropha endolucinida]MBT3012983.1 hypothetical protein [Candidatus Thiodiazotropha sp. (ex Lucina pensylvanica)]MBT3024069.1 hypothetical protein [Candidatus Thiodiazotropha taylori]MBT3037423.1 hypothetical protein [Candidatus Thiodiazotropha sp. (ex Codakia orbicularis)]MBV2101783.1 hypothetical protein [Candidatus Thiodiazotropha sp. (ex Lucina aurantia)]MBT3031194.1 hypothetical protein [Candidatus Thiodiazotropha sp. (ex Lucina pensylvanica)]